MNQTKITEKILEKTTPVLTAILIDENSETLPLSGLSLSGTLTLTLYSLSDYPTCTIINNRSSQDVLNINNVTLDSTGHLTWVLQPADTAVIDTNLSEETHRAIFEWKYNYGTKTGRYIIDFTVLNLEKIT